MKKKLISIVIPAFNEEENLDELYRRLTLVMSGLNQYDFEIMIVDNGSTDSTWKKLEVICAKDQRFKSVQLSRNFTAPGGVVAGFHHITGDAAVMMCADLQDPPEMLPRFLEKWEEGFDVVYHIVSERQGIGLIRKAQSELFHWIMSTLTEGAFPRNGSVYRLMDKSAYLALNQLGETNRYFPGLCNWIGFRSVGIEFPREKRFAGEAKSPFRVVLRIALNGIFAFSYFPLKMITVAGFLISGTSLAYLAYLLFFYILEGSQAVRGLATLISINLFLFGVLFLFMGIIGEYLARIYDEVKARPNFIVRRTLGDVTPPGGRAAVKEAFIQRAHESAAQ